MSISVTEFGVLLRFMSKPVTSWCHADGLYFVLGKILLIFSTQMLKSNRLPVCSFERSLVVRPIRTEPEAAGPSHVHIHSSAELGGPPLSPECCAYGPPPDRCLTASRGVTSPASDAVPELTYDFFKQPPASCCRNMMLAAWWVLLLATQLASCMSLAHVCEAALHIASCL